MRIDCLEGDARNREKVEQEMALPLELARLGSACLHVVGSLASRCCDAVEEAP